MKLLKAILRPFGSSFFMAAAWFALVIASVVAAVIKGETENVIVITMLCLFSLRALHFLVTGIVTKLKARAQMPDKKVRQMSAVYIVLASLCIAVATCGLIFCILSDTRKGMDLPTMLALSSFALANARFAMSDRRGLRADAE